jgi:hypothetical protein
VVHVKVILAIVALFFATPVLLLVAVALGPVALAAAGILGVVGLVLVAVLLADRVIGLRIFGPFPEPTASPRTRHQPAA